MADATANTEEADPLIARFLEHLATDRGLSVYTQRNYTQALREFVRWQREVRTGNVAWAKLERDDFRAFLRALGRQNLGRAAIQLRFSALRTFYRFLIRHGEVSGSPIKNLPMPKLARRLPRFLTAEQMEDLLEAPLKSLPKPGVESDMASSRERIAIAYRDHAVLETIYSCGLRISELCGLNVEDLDESQELVRVRGKGRKERLVPIGNVAIRAITQYWACLSPPPTGCEPVFSVGLAGSARVSPRLMQLRLKKHLAVAGLDPEITPHKLRHSYATHLLDAGA